MNKWVNIGINLIIFCVCIGLIIFGQQTIGIKYLLLQIVGLAGILGQLYFYNKKYQ